jgi:tripartite-type tricarboxylate transporter receptor subunit TctC
MQRYAAIGAPITPSTPTELALLLASETEKWGPIIREAGIKPE